MWFKTSDYTLSKQDICSRQHVVLSVCETDIGKLLGGEAPCVLREDSNLRAPKYFVLSLWLINDAPSATVLPLFYKSYKNI